MYKAGESILYYKGNGDIEFFTSTGDEELMDDSNTFNLSETAEKMLNIKEGDVFAFYANEKAGELLIKRIQEAEC